MAGAPPPYYQPQQPQYGYPPPPPTQPVHQTYIVNQPPQQVHVHQKPQSVSSSVAASLGSGLASAFRSGGQLVKGSGKTASSAAKSMGSAGASMARAGGSLATDVAQGFKDQHDKTAQSPLLQCFQMGSGIQLISKASKGCLRCLPNGELDGRGQIGPDYSCHWLIVNRWDNKVILRNGQYPQYHLANGLGKTLATGTGDAASVYKLHETLSHYITLQHEMSGEYLGVDVHQNVVPSAQVTSGGLNSQFEVHLAYSPFGHVYKPMH